MRLVVAVDPPGGVGGDACGIVAAGVGVDGLLHVLEDASVQGLPPEHWAAMVAECARRWRADCVVAEGNIGGRLVRSVLEAADSAISVRIRYASKGKSVRAEPISILYAQGRVQHCGRFPALEDEMCAMRLDGRYDGAGRSPDRADALVWAIAELREGKRPGVKTL